MSYTVLRRACYFRLGEQRLALGSEHLRQVVAVGSLTRVPRVGPELLGLFSVRGAILPLIDLRPLLGLSASPLQGVTTAALTEYEGHQLAFHLDEVFGFFPYQDGTGQDETETLSPALQAFSRGTVTPTVTSTAPRQALQAVLLDVSKVMRALETQLVAA